MIELIIGTYGLACWLVFKKFKLVPVTTYTVCTAILGGIGTPLGPFLGAALITVLETSLRARFGGIGAGVVGIYLIIYGTVLIVTMRVAPQGLLTWVGERLRRRPQLGTTS